MTAIGAIAAAYAQFMHQEGAAERANDFAEFLLGYLAGAALQEDVGIAVEWAIRVDEPHPRRTETAGTVMTHFNQEQARYCREVWQGWTPVRRTVGPWQEVTL